MNPSLSIREQQSPLTAREREILIARAVGKTNAQIGRELFLAPGTVKNHVHNLLQKLNCKTMEHAVWTFFAPAPDEIIITCAEHDALKNVVNAARRDSDKTMSVQLALAALDALRKEGA